MPSPFDLLILPLARSKGQERPEVPGLLVAVQPRRPARFRDHDQLLVYLSQEGSGPLAQEQVQALLENLAKIYYQTAGTVTTAQKSVADWLNQYLLDRNLKNEAAGRRSIGLLSQLVLREQRLYLALSGPVHAFHIAATGVEKIFEPRLAGQGLGVSRTAPVHFSLFELQANDVLLVSADPPVGWSGEILGSSQAQGPESLRRKLLSQAGPDLNAILVQAQSGRGQMRLLRPVRGVPGTSLPPMATMPGHTVEKAASAAVPAAAAVQASPQAGEAEVPAPAAPVASPRFSTDEAATAETPEVATPPASGLAEEASGIRAAGQPAQPAPELSTPGREETGPTRSAPAEASSMAVAGTSAGVPGGLPAAPGRSAKPPHTAPTAQAKSARRPATSALAGLWAALARTGRGTLAALGRLARRILPDESLFTIPPASMAFIAIAVPLVVVTVAAVFYFQRGRAAQYEVYFTQARQAGELASGKTDPMETRQAWQITLAHLDQAETYQVTADSKALRSQAQAALDSLDGVERLDFRPGLVEDLPEGTRIDRIVPDGDDLFLLDRGQGVVLRALLTNEGYRIDPTFMCGPGPYAGYIVGELIDITPLPRGNELNASLAAIDGSGNLVYCIPGAEPVAKPMTPPDIHWGTPAALTVDTGDLYILDPQTNAVWIYRGMDVASQPRLFFSEEIPPMQDVIDFAVNMNDLYMLHEDGHLTTCAYSGMLESPTRCKEEAILTDPRPGRESGPTLADATFSEILFSPPPDPSLFLLEPEAQTLYHFSMRLALQRLYRSLNKLPQAPATSMAIDKDNRTAFMAIGNQIYHAPLP